MKGGLRISRSSLNIDKMTIKDFNNKVETDYKEYSLNEVSESWFPLMKYDENYGVKKSLEDINFLSIGLNPSLTEKFAEHIHNQILGLKSVCGYRNVQKLGEKRFDAFNGDRENVVPKLVEYQSKLKYDINEQIPYFQHLTSFFKEIDDKISFKEHVFHYDFCQLRQTDSNAVSPIISKNYKLFADHFRDIINLVNPEVVFVFNAWLAKLLRENDFFSAKEIDKRYGCYFLNGKSNTSAKIILANQLSGGATSAVYRELVVWNVQRLLKIKLKYN